MIYLFSYVPEYVLFYVLGSWLTINIRGIGYRDCACPCTYQRDTNMPSTIVPASQTSSVLSGAELGWYSTAAKYSCMPLRICRIAFVHKWKCMKRKRIYFMWFKMFVYAMRGCRGEETISTIMIIASDVAFGRKEREFITTSFSQLKYLCH